MSLNREFSGLSYCPEGQSRYHPGAGFSHSPRTAKGKDTQESAIVGFHVPSTPGLTTKTYFYSAPMIQAMPSSVI